ncbi:MAG: hypothetical protein L0322_22500 [Chloroflexi bacterium]|nr:hypothetical protein [Chloroflexota bacterium]
MMKYRTLAGWQKALLVLIWVGAIGTTIVSVLVMTLMFDQLGGLLLIVAIMAPFIVAFLVSLPIALNPRGPERDIRAEQMALANENDAFSVITGQVRTRSGEVKPVSVIVPTVFGASSSLIEGVFSGAGTSSIGPGTAHVAREETLDFALQAAREQYPGCEWAGEPDLREANEQERAWALQNGINLKHA